LRPGDAFWRELFEKMSDRIALGADTAGDLCVNATSDGVPDEGFLVDYQIVDDDGGHGRWRG